MNPCPTQPSPITPSRRFPATAGLRLNCSDMPLLFAVNQLLHEDVMPVAAGDGERVGPESVLGWDQVPETCQGGAGGILLVVGGVCQNPRVSVEHLAQPVGHCPAGEPGQQVGHLPVVRDPAGLTTIRGGRLIASTLRGRSAVVKAA